MIHYVSIFDENKNFGSAINKAIERLNASDDDWIVLRDLDVAFLTPDAGNLIIEAAKSGYDLIGCTMNRLGGSHQTAPNMFDEMNLMQHYYCAETRNTCFNSEVWQFNHDIAGAFMLFSVKIWRKVKFKNSIVFDREFTKGVRMAGGKVGIMPGLYIFHAYRLWAKTREEARNSVDHLIK